MPQQQQQHDADGGVVMAHERGETAEERRRELMFQEQDEAEEVPAAILFYEPFHGHHTTHLAAVLRRLRGSGNGGTPRRCAFLLGDSSFDNKYWLSDKDVAKPINGYPLDLMRRDVCFAINAEMVRLGLGDEWFCLNAAVEATCLNDRASELLPQDELVRRSLQPRDALVVSIGGNDIALRPTLKTIANMLTLVWGVPRAWLERCADPKREPPSWWTWPPGLAHFVRLFKDAVEGYLARVTANVKPSIILVSTIYFLDTNPDAQSWANPSLKAMGYNDDPAKLQTAIRAIFRLATSQVRVPGVDVVVPVPLFEALDGTDSSMYVSRVEPSAKGGRRMAELVVRKLVENLPPS